MSNREYLDLKLGKIGEQLPNDFKFASQKTMDTIIGKIKSDMLGNNWVGQNTDEKKGKLESVIKNVSEDKGNDNEEIFYKNLTKLCIKIPFDDKYKEKEKGTGTVPYQIYNLAPEFKTKNKKDNTEKTKQIQYIIGRVDSISNFSGYKLKMFKTLFLAGDTFQWTPFVNDLFITCSYAYAKFHQIKKTQETTDGKTTESINDNDKNLIFPIMLVMAKSCVTEAPYECSENNVDDCVEHPQVFLKSTIDTKTLEEVMQTQKNSGTEHPHRTCVFSGISDNINKHPSVTFRELVILADILGMDVYKLKTPDTFDLNTDKFYIYYFSLPKKDGNFQKLIDAFNTANSGQGFRLVKIQIKWARTARQSGGDYEKYLEYKQKYVVLKKISNVNK